MKIAELKKDNTEYHAKITIPAKGITEAIDKELKTAAKTAKMDGFRVGKVPASILKKKYEPSIRADIVHKELSKAIDDVIKKESLNVATDPAVDDLVNESGKDLSFTLKFELLPEIPMPDFKMISVEKPTLTIADKDIDEQLKRLTEFSKSYDKESKGKAAKGDQITIDAIGYVDGEAFDGGKLDAHKLVLGSGSFIPGFEDQLIGAKAGDDISVKVDFPEEYHAKDLAGKPAEFKTQVKAVHKESEVKIDDEFAKKFNCETVAKLKEQISTNIESSYSEPVHVMMKLKLFDKLEGLMKFDVPKSLLEREIEILEKQTDQVDQEEDDDLKNKSDEEKKEYFAKLAARRVRIGLLLAEYIKLNKLNINEDDIRKAIVAQARNYPGQEQQVIEYYQKNREALESLKGPIMEEKAVQAIFDNEIIVNEKAYSKDKLEKLLEKEMKN